MIGAGQWGPNHIRNFQEIPGARVVGVADLQEARLDPIRQRFPGVEARTDYRTFLGRSDVDAVVVATPVSTHVQIVSDALESGKDVLAEKPLAVTSAECRILTEKAQQSGRVLMVGHVFLFNAGILKLKEILQSGDLGPLYYFHATRTNLGPVRSDTNAVGDLASHDIAILNFLLGGVPTHVSSTGMGYLQGAREDVAFVTLFYPNRVLANLHISWLDPLKVRRITVVGSQRMAVWDDLSQQGPVAVYSKGVVREPVPPNLTDYGEFQLLVKEGEINIPLVHQVEPLRVQAQYFIRAVQDRSLQISDGRFATDVVRVVESINDSIAACGGRVAVPS